jgi:hypothetical protein
MHREIGRHCHVQTASEPGRSDIPVKDGHQTLNFPQQRSDPIRQPHPHMPGSSTQDADPPWRKAMCLFIPFLNMIAIRVVHSSLWTIKKMPWSGLPGDGPDLAGILSCLHNRS